MFKFRWRTPPPTLHLLYMGVPVALLEKVKLSDQELFHFQYLPAFREAELAPLPGLPEQPADHWSSSLWAYFAERIPDVRRPEIEVFMRERRISRHDELRMLAELGSRSVTDPFEIRKVA